MIWTQSVFHDKIKLSSQFLFVDMQQDPKPGPGGRHRLPLQDRGPDPGGQGPGLPQAGRQLQVRAEPPVRGRLLPLPQQRPPQGARGPGHGHPARPEAQRA